VIVRIFSDGRALLLVVLLFSAEKCKTEHKRAGIAHQEEFL